MIGALAALTLALHLFAGEVAASGPFGPADASAAAAKLQLAFGDAFVICEQTGDDATSPAPDAHRHRCDACALCAAVSLPADVGGSPRIIARAELDSASRLPLPRATLDADSPLRQRRQAPRGPPPLA